MLSCESRPDRMGSRNAYSDPPFFLESKSSAEPQRVPGAFVHLEEAQRKMSLVNNSLLNVGLQASSTPSAQGCCRHRLLFFFLRPSTSKPNGRSPAVLLEARGSFFLPFKLALETLHGPRSSGRSCFAGRELLIFWENVDCSVRRALLKLGPIIKLRFQPLYFYSRGDETGVSRSFGPLYA
jgi:hypothetical protein